MVVSLNYDVKTLSRERQVGRVKKSNHRARDLVALQPESPAESFTSPKP